MVTNFKETNPYLSIVIASRNDNHGGNMLRRMQVSLNGLLEQLEKYRIESELILIEWNPPVDKPLLKDVIKWPSKSRYSTIRTVQVPFSIHRRYRYFYKEPMNLMTAYNYGIRRARGQFILPGMIDLLYPDELMDFIVSKGLRENERYRVDRYDVNRDILQRDTLKEQLEYCKQNIIHIYRYKPYCREGLPELHTAACGDFQLMSRKYWHLLHGFREEPNIIASYYADSLLSYASYAAGVKEIVLSDPLRIYHIDHDDKFVDREKILRPGFEKLLSPVFKAVRPIIPSYISKKAVFFYHNLINSRNKSEAHGVPIFGYIDHLNLARDVVSGKRSYIFNDENWGLGQENLPESIIKRADWDKK